MPLQPVNINKWLLPLSWLYGLVVFFRNKLFDFGILKRKEYGIPVICIGNIAVGGTGKTPHIEYLVELLKDYYKVAVLSRGYKRKSKGFVLATAESTAKEIGDEPYQIKNKFPDIMVAVDANRCRGIDTLLALDADQRPEVILLDDAFQHRYVKPSYSIVLTDYNRLMSCDKLLPAGRLREPKHKAEEANTVIVTKCPSGITPIDQRLVAKDLELYPYQKLYFTEFSYGALIPVFEEGQSLGINDMQLSNFDVLGVTGIANPQTLYEKIRHLCKNCAEMTYPDHRNFTKSDINKIKRNFDAISNTQKIIITTEKDAARFRGMQNIPEELKAVMFYLPIEVRFINEEEEKIFKNKILDHVRKNK